MSLDVDPTTPDHSVLSRGEGTSSSPKSSGAEVAGSGADAPVTRSRPCPYTDVRVSHGGAATAAAASSSAAPASSGSAPWPESGDDWRPRTLTFLTNVLPHGTPKAWVEAQRTGQTVRGFEPGPLPEGSLIPPEVLAERMVGRMAGGNQRRPSMPKAKAKLDATPRTTAWPASEQTWTDPRFWMNDLSSAPSSQWTADEWESWHSWQSSSWWDDTARNRQRQERGPYAKGKGKKGKKGKDDRGPAS